jgi:hypothetical protein
LGQSHARQADGNDRSKAAAEEVAFLWWVLHASQGLHEIELSDPSSKDLDK